MADLMREAEEELRRETAESLAKRAAPWVIGGIVLALVAGAGWQVWQARQAKAVAEGAAAYDAAIRKLQANDLAGGAAALETLAKSTPGGLGTLAAIQRGAVLQEQGDAKAAAAAFDAAAEKARDPDLADLARLRAAWAASAIETREQSSARLKPVVDRKGAFAPLAREMLAAAAWNAGDLKAARAEYDLLQLDPNAPEGLRARAAQAIAIMDAAAGASATPMVVPQAPGQAPAPGQAAAPAPPGQERVVRLPPGVKLPPGFQPPPGVRVIETPGPAGAPATGGGAVSADVLAEIERERQAAMARQKAVTEAQQKQVDAITKARQAEAAAPPAPVEAPPAKVEAPTPAPPSETTPGASATPPKTGE